MPISMIVGKPGSGKSYYAVSKIADMVRDWCDFEKKQGKPFRRKLYTNLHLNEVEFQKFIDARIGPGVDVKKYLIHLEEDFFYKSTESGGKMPFKWWLEIPDEAFIVIDEVHQYMPQGGTGGKDYMQLFSEYVSVHRHHKHDLILITQHTDTIHKNILCMATDIFHVVNVKNKVFPFLRIPFADFDVVKEAFGCKRQIATVLYGNYVGRAVKIQSEFSIVLKPEIFALYQSHVYGKESSGEAEDRPSLSLSPGGAILWFARRHWFHLSIKAGAVYCGVSAMWFMCTSFPTVLADTVSANTQISMPEKKPIVTEPKVKEVSEVSPVTVPSVQSVSDLPVRETFKQQREKDFYNSTGIYIYGLDFIVLRDAGRVNVGERFEYEGKKVILVSVDFKRKKIITDDVVFDAGGLSSDSSRPGDAGQFPVLTDSGSTE